MFKVYVFHILWFPFVMFFFWLTNQYMSGERASIMFLNVLFIQAKKKNPCSLFKIFHLCL